jgi:hypothetical protein
VQAAEVEDQLQEQENSSQNNQIDLESAAVASSESFNSFTDHMEDIIEKDHWKTVVASLHRQQQQSLTLNLLQRLQLEANILSNGASNVNEQAITLQQGNILSTLTNAATQGANTTTSPPAPSQALGSTHPTPWLRLPVLCV